MTTNEKEILLEEIHEEKTEPEQEIQEVHENSKNNTENPESPMKFVERKNVSQLTEDERNIIVANARAGVEQPNFAVTFFKNGNFRITKKKVQVPTVAQKVIKQTPASSNSPTFYTDNQLLFEHIIELTSKVEKLTAKHKKLKHKYKDLQHDLYIDDNDDEIVDEKIEHKVTEPKQEESPQIIPKTIVPPRRVNWRNQIQFL